MLVTKITKKGNSILVVFDDVSSILLNYNVYIDSMLRKNDNVNEQFIEELKKKNEAYKIKYLALNLLGRRSHSKRELFQKLTKKGFDKVLISKVLDDLSEINYINDDDFAEKYAEEKIKKGKSGIIKIRAELYKKGIDKSIIQKIEEKYNDNNEMNDSIFVLASKKLESLNKKESDSRKIKSKLYSHLLGKGFTSEQIKDVFYKLDL